jgi:hypothetical protein
MNVLHWQKVSRFSLYRLLGVLASLTVLEEYSRFLELRKLLGAHDDHLESTDPHWLTVKPSG